MLELCLGHIFRSLLAKIKEWIMWFSYKDTCNWLFIVYSENSLLCEIHTFLFSFYCLNLCIVILIAYYEHVKYML